MRIQELLRDDDAVSPVIGVILMVAITVILAAVIASFVLGLGDTQDTAPTVSFDFDYTEAGTNYLEVTKSSGDAVDGSNLYVRGSNPPSAFGSNSVGDTLGGSGVTALGGWGGGELSAGQGFNITGVSSDASVRRWRHVRGTGLRQRS